jgi:hypothetical protein
MMYCGYVCYRGWYSAYEKSDTFWTLKMFAVNIWFIFYLKEKYAVALKG